MLKCDVLNFRMKGWGAGLGPWRHSTTPGSNSGPGNLGWLEKGSLLNRTLLLPQGSQGWNLSRVGVELRTNKSKLQK